MSLVTHSPYPKKKLYSKLSAFLTLNVIAWIFLFLLIVFFLLFILFFLTSCVLEGCLDPQWFPLHCHHNVESSIYTYNICNIIHTYVEVILERNLAYFRIYLLYTWFLFRYYSIFTEQSGLLSRLLMNFTWYFLLSTLLFSFRSAKKQKTQKKFHLRYCTWVICMISYKAIIRCVCVWARIRYNSFICSA